MGGAYVPAVGDSLCGAFHWSGFVILPCLHLEEGMPMRVEFTMEGGLAHFPGLSKPVVIESSQLSEEEAAELGRLVEATRFFDLPPKVNIPPHGAADYRRYTVTIQAGARRHTVELTDPVKTPELQRLLSFLKVKARELRAPR
jgi:emfourin